MKKLVCLTLFAFGAAGCDPLENAFFDDTPRNPACQGTTATVEGTWEISGQGERFDCSDSTFDAPLFSLSSVPLQIVQTDAVFGLSTDVLLDGFTLSDGRVDGRCITFRTAETTELGTITYRWSGQVGTSSVTITGEFTGSGWNGCITRGSFRVDFTPAP